MDLHRHLALVFLTVSLPAGPGAIEEGSGSLPVTIEATSPAWRQRVDWAVGRFVAAGLDLPEVVVTVHDDGQVACGGNGGRYHPARTPEVHLCSSSRPDSRAARLLTLHELGHAWAEARLDAGERRELLTQRRLAAWIDPALPPHEWGAEHAAELLSWGLMDEAVPIVRIEDAGPDRLAEGFLLLAGRAPLWTVLPDCHSPS